MSVPQPNRVSSGAPGEMGFDLCIDPNPRFVSVVRRFVEAALDRLLADPEAVFRISMSAHELMENAAKYSIGNRTVLRVSYQRAGRRAPGYRFTCRTRPRPNTSIGCASGCRRSAPPPIRSCITRR